MWVIGSFVFLAPAALITFRLLQPTAAIPLQWKVSEETKGKNALAG
jgi:hypothetical protein